MQQRKKHILGVFGLGLVAAITAVACALPTPDASAANNGDTDIKVVVHSETPSLVIQRPLDGDEFTSPQISVSNIYSKVAGVHYKLTYIDSNGTRTDYNLPEFIATTSGTADGVHDFTFDLNNYGGQYGQYVLNASFGAASDSVSFSYRAVRIDDGGTTTDPATGDPVVTVEYGDEVCSLKFQAYNKATGAALFNPEFVYNIPTPRPDPSIAKVKLPFSASNASADDYRIVVKAFGCGNNQDDQIGDEDNTDIDNYQPQDDDEIIKGENGDPTVVTNYSFTVEACSVKFQAFSKATGAALFQPELPVHTIDPPSRSGTIRVTLPFAEYEADSGDYNIVATFYDCAGNVIQDKNLDFDGYIKPRVPGVPDTGGGIFAGLNFSRVDYLVTGLIVFMIALVIAIRLMAKNRKSNRR